MQTPNLQFNLQFLKTLSPCKEGLDNFTSKFENFNGSLTEALKLDLPYADKVWAIRKLIEKEIISKEIAVRWAAKMAESVLHLTTDERVHSAVKYLLLGDFSNKEELQKHRQNCWAAADAFTRAAAADAAAYAAAYAAADAAYADAAAADTADAAARAAYAYTSARKEQQSKNIQLLIDVLEGKCRV
jgi:hypothetical protein